MPCNFFLFTHTFRILEDLSPGFKFINKQIRLSEKEDVETFIKISLRFKNGVHLKS